MLSNHNVSIDPSQDEQQLIDPDVIKRFTEYAEIEPDETVLEIGPGAGNITEKLQDKARYLICIEKNPKYIPILRERFGDSDKLKLIQDDALETYLPKHQRLVSNLPYMIAESFFQKTLRLDFESATLILPLGFVDTLTTRDSDKYTKLSWQAQLFYGITLQEKVSEKAYLPEPQTKTAIITMKHRQNTPLVDSVLIEMIQQGDKYTKNALRESLIRCSVADTKRQAKSLVSDLGLGKKTLNSWASRLSLEELEALKERLSLMLQEATG